MEFLLIDIAFLDLGGRYRELIRQMDFNLSTCKMVSATHADVDHIPGWPSTERVKTNGRRHPSERRPARNRRRRTHLRIHQSQGIELPRPRAK